MVHVQRVLLLIIVLVAVGCSSTNQSVPSTISSVDIKTTYDPAAEFPRRGEYAFVRFMPDPEATPEAMVIDKRIRSAIQT
ncbi:MAG: hypothetical protein ACYTFW_09065 [Planctomycetota bacterium]